MPIQRCQVGGSKGWKYGKSGKCYTGKDGRKNALAQARAIKSSQAREGKSTK